MPPIAGLQLIWPSATSFCVTSSVRAERRKLNAAQFDCDFFETGNLTKTCKATGGAKAVMVSTTSRSGTSLSGLAAAQMVDRLGDADGIPGKPQPPWIEGLREQRRVADKEEAATA